jgi:integrase
VERKGPPDDFDKHGKLAQDALLEALVNRRPPVTVDTLGTDTLVTALVGEHLKRLAEDGRSPATLATYEMAAGKLSKFLAGVRVREATPARIDAALRSMRTTHGPTMAKQAKTVLLGGMQLAVLAEVVTANPVRDVSPIVPKSKPKGAPPLNAGQLRDLLIALHSSDYCAQHDLADPITLLIATGLRRSELLALRWEDFDPDTGTLTVVAKLVRATGYGLQRINDTKTVAGQRSIALPPFAVTMLQARRGREYVGEQPMIFPSTGGTWRDPDNFGGRWRRVRDDLEVPTVTSHSFRKAMADLIDDAGLSARTAADLLGHARVSMTTDVYMSRGRLHSEVADLLERAVINAE